MSIRYRKNRHKIGRIKFFDEAKEKYSIWFEGYEDPRVVSKETVHDKDKWFIEDGKLFKVKIEAFCSDCHRDVMFDQQEDEYYCPLCYDYKE